MREFKENDIFRWSYNEATLKAKDDGNNSGTTYWCCAMIGIFHNGSLVDTFWHGSGNKSWNLDDIHSQLDLTYIGNMDDLIPAEPSERAYYLDEDCVDLNHPNSSRGNFYIRKGAKKNLEKMERILKRGILEVENEISSQLRSIDNMKEALADLSVDTRMWSTPNDLYLFDKHWSDSVQEDL